MKNDFDFIKDKIENSSVNAPDTMDEGFVLNKLEGITPDPVPHLVEVKPKKSHAALIAGLAAAFVAVIALSVVGVIYSAHHHIHPDNSSLIRPSVSADIPLKTFQSYDEVKEYAATIQKYHFSGTFGIKDGAYAVEEERTADAAAPENNSSEKSSGSSAGSSGGSESYSETYRQVEGVDEADIVKTDGKYLYITSEGGDENVMIYTADDRPELVATVYPGSFDRPTVNPVLSDDDTLDVFVQEMYVTDGRLIVVCMTRGGHFDYNTAALVYDISDVKNIRLIDRLNQSGYYSTSRMIGDRLYMLSEYDVYPDEFEAPICCRGDENKEIPVDCVYSVEHPTDTNMLIVGGFDLSDGSTESQSSAILGSVEDVYCNESNLYIYTTKWKYDVLIDYAEAENSYIPKQSDDTITTDIYKVSLTDGIRFTAFGTVEGYLDSRYSLDEKDGYLRVAATVENNKGRESNALYILDSNLKEVGKTTGFAKDESIKAVRYVGDTAYVITYEETDPLFVIDLSDPAKPTILGEVKIDGFSTMLVPIDDNTVLGLGVYTDNRPGISMEVQSGFKLALFDVSDKLHPKVLDEKSYPNYYSSVMTEPRALVYNPDRDDYLIPLNFEDTHLNSEIDYYMPDIRGGALNFKVQDGRLVEIDRPVINSDNADADLISRCLYVGENIYMISNEYYESVEVYTAKYK